MNIRRLALRGLLAVIDASLANHVPVNVSDQEGPVCAACRPSQLWPCQQFTDLTTKRQPIEDELTGHSA